VRIGGTSAVNSITNLRRRSEYVPAHLKNKDGYVIQNESTLRIDAAGPRVYALGDIGSYSTGGIFDIMQGLPVLETNLKRDLLAAHRDSSAIPEGQDRMYTKNEKEMQIVPVGPSKGVGAIFGWRVPSIFVWLLKGRDYMIPKGSECINGSRWKKES
jgi:apoptosis-inducing factor 2